MSKIEELKAKLTALNTHINSLKTWDSYAESCQREYDWLLSQLNELLSKETK